MPAMCSLFERRGAALILAVVVACAWPAWAQKPLTARQVIEKIKLQIGAPVDPNTVDTFKAGDPEATVTGIATTFLASYAVLQEAVASGANLIITHEPTFYNHLDETAFLKGDPIFEQKMAYIREHHLVIWRFHDQWHWRKPDGIIEGFTQAVGWEKYRRPYEQNIFTLPPTTVGQLAAALQAKLNSRIVRIVGDPGLRVTDVAYLPGASGESKEIKALERDDVQVLVAGEAREWETVEYVRDAAAEGRAKALILLGHEVSEESGMEYCARWLRGLFPRIPVTFVPAGEPFQNLPR
ncbi:MAG TPA: Nif3-like dinuclear metal center hexameric protein [Terriglobales bacterium]|nr:Nif3-like dinuclear metal center hexameric protein [Terriglobales bacterium]